MQEWSGGNAAFLSVIRKNVESTFFSFFCDQGKNVESEKILKFDIFVVKFKKEKMSNSKFKKEKMSISNFKKEIMSNSKF